MLERASCGWVRHTRDQGVFERREPEQRGPRASAGGQGGGHVLLRGRGAAAGEGGTDDPRGVHHRRRRLAGADHLLRLRHLVEPIPGPA